MDPSDVELVSSVDSTVCYGCVAPSVLMPVESDSRCYDVVEVGTLSGTDHKIFVLRSCLSRESPGDGCGPADNS